MSFLSDFYKKAKKKLSDAFNSTENKVSSSFGSAYDGFKKSARSAVDYANNPQNTPDWMKSVDKGLHDFSSAAENVPKFNFSQKIKNPVGKFAAVIPETILNLPSNTVRTTLKDYGKIKATPSYMVKRGAEAANVGIDIGSTIAGGPIIKSLAKEGFKRAGKATLGQVFKEGAKRGAVEGGIYGTAQGALSGAQEGENLKEQGKNALKMGVMGGVTGVAAGGVLGGAISSAGHESSRIIKDVKNFKSPYTKRVVTKYDYEPVPGVFGGPNGQNQRRPIIGSERKVVETIKTPFQPQSITGKLLTVRPGMNIKDVNMSKPKVISSTDHAAVMAQKRAQAAEKVNRQISNQKAGLPTAEPGFVAPQNVAVPEKKPLPSIDEFVNENKGIPVDKAGMFLRDNMKGFTNNLGQTKALYNSLKKTHPNYWKDELDNFIKKESAQTKKPMPSIDEFINEKPSSTPFKGNIPVSEEFPIKKTHKTWAADKELAFIKPEWKTDYKMIRNDLNQVIKDEADHMMSLKNEVGGVGSYEKIGEGQVGGDTGVRRFSSNPQWYRDFFEKNGRAPAKWEVAKIAENNLKSGNGLNIEKYNNLNRVLLDMQAESVKAANKVGAGLNPTYNSFQQKSFDKKLERINSIDTLLNYPAKLRQIGYKKNEIDRIGKDQAERIIKLGELGFPKNAIPKDLLSDQVDRIIKNNVSWGDLKAYYARKNELNTHFLDGIDPRTLQDINPLMTGGRDVYRNFESVFGNNYSKIKAQLLDPFDAAKGELFKEQAALADEVFDQVVKKLGINKGSALDKAVVGFGEGKISLEKLQEDFPNDWQKVVDADQWFRNKYPELLNDLNMVREANFPTHPLYPESTKIIPQRKDYYRHGKEMEGFAGLKNMFESSANIDPSLAVTSDVTNPKTKWLSFAQKRKGDANDFGAVEGYLDYIKNHSYAKHIDPFIQKFKGVDDEAKNLLPGGAFSNEKPRIGLAEELSQKLDPIQQITESNDQAQIRKLLMDKGVSEQQSEWMSKELADMSNYDKTKAFLKNKLSKNKGNQFENLNTASSLAEESQNKENNFLVFIKNFSRDLAGKTNPLDRPFQENVFGRKALSVVNWANSRFKANAVLGNASSSIAQFFNIPQGIASAGIKNSAKGLGQSLAGIFAENGPIKQSSFVRERTFNGYNKFDTGILDNTKKFAIWMTGIGDEIGTKFIWNSHYQKALSEGIANPVKYADDWTRKMVAGRGIGEVPIIQKSKIFQLVAPFQLEVANQWYALRDIAKNDPRKLVIAKKMLEYSVASYFMNAAAKKIRGADVSFDPINAMTEAYSEYQKEDDKLKGSAKAFGRLVGEGVSNLPIGQTIASIYPEYGFGIDKENFPTAAKLLNNPRKDFMGQGDPTRFGTGGLPLFSAIKNPLTGLMTSYGGKQIEKTYGGAKSLMQGYVENNSGKIMTAIERTPANIAKGLLFGKNALGEMQNYFDNNGTPLSDLQTEKYKLMGNSPEYFNKISAERLSNKEREALKIGKSPSETKNLSDDISQLSNGKVYVKSLDQEFKTEKDALMAISMDDLASSDANFKDLNNGWVLRKGEDGNVVKQRRDSYDSGLNMARLSSYKKNEDLKNWRSTADKQIELLNKMIIDPSIDDLDKVKIENALDTLINDYQKYGEYGGFKKGKKVAEKYKYPLVDPEFIRINAMISGLNGSKKPLIRKRGIPLMGRRLPSVRRRRLIG